MSIAPIVSAALQYEPRLREFYTDAELAARSRAFIRRLMAVPQSENEKAPVTTTGAKPTFTNADVIESFNARQ